MASARLGAGRPCAGRGWCGPRRAGAGSAVSWAQPGAAGARWSATARGLRSLRCIAEQREYYDVPHLDQPVDPLPGRRRVGRGKGAPSRQYTSIRYLDRLSETGTLPSTGSVSDSYDNALAESLRHCSKAELVRWEGPWRGLEDLELATLIWVDWSTTAASTPAWNTRHRLGRDRDRVLPSAARRRRAPAPGVTDPAHNPGRLLPAVVIRSRPQGAHDRGV